MNNQFIQCIQHMTQNVALSQWSGEDYLRVMNSFKGIVHNSMNSFGGETAYLNAGKFCLIAAKFIQSYTNEDVITQDYYVAFAEINLNFANYAAHYYKRDSGELVPAFKEVLCENLQLALNALDRALYRYDERVKSNDLIRKASMLFAEISEVYAFMGYPAEALDVVMRAIKSRFYISDFFTESEDFYMMSALCGKASALTKNKPMFHALFDLMGKFYSGDKFINYEYFLQIVHICVKDIENKSSDDIFILCDFIREMRSCAGSSVLPESKLKKQFVSPVLSERELAEVKEVQDLKEQIRQQELKLKNPQDQARQQEMLSAARLQMKNKLQKLTDQQKLNMMQDEVSIMLDRLYLIESDRLEQTNQGILAEFMESVGETKLVAEDEKEQKPSASVSTINMFNEMADVLITVGGISDALEALAETSAKKPVRKVTEAALQKPAASVSKMNIHNEKAGAQSSVRDMAEAYEALTGKFAATPARK